MTCDVRRVTCDVCQVTCAKQDHIRRLHVAALAADLQIARLEAGVAAGAANCELASGAQHPVPRVRAPTPLDITAVVADMTIDVLQSLQPDQLRLLARLAARIGDVLTAMMLLRCVFLTRAYWLNPPPCSHIFTVFFCRQLLLLASSDAAHHRTVCTALHLHNDFCTLHSFLQRVECTRDFFMLFAEAQRAVGTRVFFDVSYLHCDRAVLFVSPSEFCVMRDDASLMLRVQLRDVTSVTVHDGACCVHISDTVAHYVHASNAAAAVCDALSRRVAPALDWAAAISRADALVELRANWFSLLTADWCARLRIILAQHPLLSINKMGWTVS